MDSEKPTADPLGLSQDDLEALFESTFSQVADGVEKKTGNITPKTPLFEPSFSGKESQHFQSSRNEKFKAEADPSRVKSSLRMKYEAEVMAIKKSHGDLEGIRRKLGLSKRKVAQLLLVDPSAWTRWTKKDGEAPPHIFRALQWYLLLQDKHPEYRSSLWLNAVATPSISAHEIENIKRQVVDQVRAQIDQYPTIIETETVDLRPLERRLKSSQKQVKDLEKHLRWLILSQGLLLLGLVLIAIF